MIGSPVYPFHGDAIIVCVDCEGWQGAGNVSEVGITILDTRNLAGVHIAEWRRTNLHSFHYRMTDFLHVHGPTHPKLRHKFWPDKFQHGKSQYLPLADTRSLFELFFRIPYYADPAEFVDYHSRHLCAGSPVKFRDLDPATYVKRNVTSAPVQGKGKKRKGKGRERTPDMESEDEAFQQEYFTIDFGARQDKELDDELERKCEAMQQLEPIDILEPHDYQQALAALRQPVLSNDNNDDEQVVFQNARGGVVRLKGTAANAQIRALERNFGDEIPQSFIRPKFKVVYSPRFPQGLLPYPQRRQHYDGTIKIIPRRFNCPHFWWRADMVSREEDILCDGCDE